MVTKACICTPIEDKRLFGAKIRKGKERKRKRRRKRDKPLYYRNYLIIRLKYFYVYLLT
jgi:hypothetical protein